VSKVQKTGPLSDRTIQSENVGTVCMLIFQRGFDQSRERVAGANFNKCTDTRGQHFINGADKLDGVSEMPAEQIEGPLRIGWIWPARRVCENRKPRLLEWMFLQLVAEGPGGIGDEWAVKRCRYRQTGRAHAAIREG
jgi:hypothetical protein